MCLLYQVIQRLSHCFCSCRRDYHLQSAKAEQEASHDVARAAFKSMGASTTSQGKAAHGLLFICCKLCCGLLAVFLDVAC